MAPDFNAEMRCQNEWGWLLAIWLFLSGTAGGLFLIYQIAELPVFFGLLAIAVLVVGGGVLLLEQGSPLRAWRATSGIRTSWLSRGTVFVASFLACATLSLTLKWLTAPPSMSGLAELIGWIASVFALLVVLYPAFFLANNRSVPFWHTPMLPIVFLIYACMGASAVVLTGADRLDHDLASYRLLATGSIASAIVVLGVFLYTMARAHIAARESVKILNRAPLGWILWGGVVFVGSLLPLALLLTRQETPQLAGACMLVGGLLLRYCVLKAGVLVPAALAQKGFELIRLNRTNVDDLAREYGHTTEGTSANEG